MGVWINPNPTKMNLRPFPTVIQDMRKERTWGGAQTGSHHPVPVTHPSSVLLQPHTHTHTPPCTTTACLHPTTSQTCRPVPVWSDLPRGLPTVGGRKPAGHASPPLQGVGTGWGRGRGGGRWRNPNSLPQTQLPFSTVASSQPLTLDRRVV